MQDAKGVICAELVRDFLEHYKLDYSLSIFMPEVNLNQQQKVQKEEISQKVGLPPSDGQQPLLMQLLDSFMDNKSPVKDFQRKEEFKMPTTKAKQPESEFYDKP